MGQTGSEGQGKGLSGLVIEGVVVLVVVVSWERRHQVEDTCTLAEGEGAAADIRAPVCPWRLW